LIEVKKLCVGSTTYSHYLHVRRIIILDMATPMAGGFGTGANAGMTEQQIQEQKMIKLVRHFHFTAWSSALVLTIADELGSARVLRRQIRHRWSHGIRSGRNVRSLHVVCSYSSHSFVASTQALTTQPHQMRYDNTMTPAGEAISKLPMRQQLSQGFRDMGRASWSSAKNFGMIGAAYSGVECTIEGLRAKNDLANGVMAGCITGGGLAAKSGPQAMAIGCAGFAAFSAAIDYYTRMPSDDPGADKVT